MEERFRFVEEYENRELDFSELCRVYGVSRKTGYKWLQRYTAGGIANLEDRSRAPHRHPNEVSERTQEQIVELRLKHPSWGPKKLWKWLQQHEPGQSWPAKSTMGALLKHRGLSWARRPRRHATPTTSRLVSADVANQVWTTDYKGWFRCGNGQVCYPLTISDLASRYLLRCQAMKSTDQHSARAVFEAAFREYGLPERIRSDNGTPFASVGVQGLSRLSIWWLKLGIELERIDPGSPQQNGAHERMHRTLKAEATRPPGWNLRRQQEKFDVFRTEFNEERPHEALGFVVPAECYRLSPRCYPARVTEPEYPGEFQRRRIDHGGAIRWQDARCFIGEALGGEQVGVEPIGERHWRVWFGKLILGDFEEAREPRRAQRRRSWLRLQSPSGLLPPEPTVADND